MTEETFHVTKEDIRKAESKQAGLHHGKTPAESEVSAMKSIIDSKRDKSKQEIIDQRKANLPLPEDPPAPSDWNSFDERTVNVGSGRLETEIAYGDKDESLREPATVASSARVDGEEWKKATEPGSNVGRQAHDHLSGLPKDALAR